MTIIRHPGHHHPGAFTGNDAQQNEIQFEMTPCALSTYAAPQFSALQNYKGPLH